MQKHPYQFEPEPLEEKEPSIITIAVITFVLVFVIGFLALHGLT